MTDPALLAEADQKEATAREDGRVAAAYYRALVEGGVPEVVAGRAFLSWHAAWFCDGITVVCDGDDEFEDEE